VLKRTRRVRRLGFRSARTRVEYMLGNGARVVVKVKPTVSRELDPCRSCRYRNVCVEGYCDYFRVTPEFRAYPCYLRRDLGVDLLPLLASSDPAGDLRLSLKERFGIGRNGALEDSKLRLVNVPYCNFRCRFPRTNVCWCLFGE